MTLVLSARQILGSAYLLGAGPDHLRATDHNVSLDLDTWQPSSLTLKER